ncbi:peptidoglycan-binding protein [Streptomyces sp. ISL-43]|uniref:aggregation-promoting factor C-terminal-like domain-containing protein n=1 Tax=Streptomyces sp. ISL-43 TaxID=2819183 RepID=UPI001BE8C8F0|nr:peptidoglycan-binding protein [Streptomyces sp. ISL-43]MBT2449919.1 peptidoglycan-binding protein [Streptomyces sp. ISL-43]
MRGNVVSAAPTASRLRIPAAAAALLGAALLVPALGTTQAHAVDSVRWEQTNLAGLGYLASSGVDGVDGPGTRAALKEFQQDNGLAEDGAYGDRSELALHRQVEAVQRKAGVAADGLYGDGTKSAVKRRQSAHGEGADGIAGPATMSDMGVPRTLYQVAQSQFGAHGWTVSAQFGCLKSLWIGESNWKVYATNPSSGAYGIPQSLPGNKMAVSGGDWADNPVTQIKWGLKYIDERYGTPCKAYDTWKARSPHWY